MAAVLSLLAVVCLTLVGWRTSARAREQRAIQALWNARAGREHYLATGRITPELALDVADPRQVCRTRVGADGTLTFEGLSHGVSRQLLCLQGDPSRVTEVP